jgi:hypothetical protein
VEKKTAGALRALLAECGAGSFLAHEDIDVSQEWRERILNELKVCNVFIPLLSRHFRESEWASQEIGLAYSRANVLLIPLSTDGTMPFGFIKHLQGKPFGSLRILPGRCLPIFR